jgi:hypothetical protein
VGEVYFNTTRPDVLVNDKGVLVLDQQCIDFIDPSDEDAVGVDSVLGLKKTFHLGTRGGL